MPITSVTSDPEALSLTIVGDYPVPVAQLWEAWADPRKLEKFWGPEGWPATFTRHDMKVGGRAEYHMTGPDGSTAHGWWRFVAVEPSRRFEIEDGFADKSGRPDATMPTTRMTVTFESTPTGARFTLVGVFPSLEAMERLAAMGMIDGMQSALKKLDAVLAHGSTA